VFQTKNIFSGKENAHLYTSSTARKPVTNTKNSRNLHSRTASPPLHIPISGTNSKKSSGATYTSPHSVLIEKRKISEERYIYPAERKTPTYGLQKYRDRKNIPVFRPERHTEKSHIFKVFILQAQILKFLSRC